MPQTLVRRSSETPRTYYFDFGLFPELADDADELETVVSVTATPSGLTLDDEAIDGSRVSVTIEGGADGITYLLKCVVETAGGSRLEASGRLKIDDA